MRKPGKGWPLGPQHLLSPLLSPQHPCPGQGGLTLPHFTDEETDLGSGNELPSILCTEGWSRACPSFPLPALPWHTRGQPRVQPWAQGLRTLAPAPSWGVTSARVLGAHQSSHL